LWEKDLSSIEPVSGRARNSRLLATFWVVAAVTSALFLVPAFIIRPFSYQSARGLALAITLKQWAGWGTLIGGLISAGILLVLWAGLRRRGKILLGVGMFLVAACATMSRLNYFEWMFHPVPKPGFVSADNAKLDAGEMVLALNFNNDARAYPVSQMAYHHIVNDYVGGVPVAVTY
jgi:Protein of unknown function (DUF3179)